MRARGIDDVMNRSTPAPTRPGLSPLPLEVEGMGRAFGKRTVIENVSIRLEPGQRAALVGGNGSGKTTFIRCVAGTLTPTRGTVAVDGRQAGSMGARHRLGCSLAQERSFYLRLSGLENLLFFARLRHERKRSASTQVREIVDELDLQEIAARRVDTCSAGMLQQLALARALLGEPSLLLLDEPTRSLDEDAIARLWAALERRRHVAAVIATHRKEDLDHCDITIDFPT